MEKEKLLHIMTHPIRYRIVKEIAKSGKSYVNQIARKLKLGRKLVSYHLLTLSQHGIVVGSYGLRSKRSTDEKGRPIIVRYYELTDQAKALLSRL